MIKNVVGLILDIFILLAIGINLYFESNKRSNVTNKYLLLLRGFYPDITRQIDRAYSNNPDSLIKKAQAHIDERQTMFQAAIEAK